MAIALLAGCSQWNEPKVDVKKSADEATDLMDRRAPTMPAGQAQHHDGVFGGAETVERAHGDALPSGRVVLNSFGTPLTVREIAQELGVQLGLEADVVDDEVPGAGGGPAAVASATGGGGGRNGGCTMKVKYEGAPGPFLDSLATLCDLYWTHRHGHLVILQYETAYYTVYVDPEDVTANASVKSSGITPVSGGNGGSGGGGGSSSMQGSQSSGQSLEQTTSANSVSNSWDDIKLAIAGMIGRGRVDVVKNSRMIIVTARHSAQAKVARFVAEINRSAKSQVLFDIRILQVTMTGNRDLGTSLAAALNQAAGQYAISSSTPALPVMSGLGVATVTVQNGTNGKTNPWSGSGLVVNALESFSHVNERQHLTAQTTNGLPVPVTIARQLSYVASTSLTTGVTGSAALSAMQEGTLTLGLTMQLTPVVYDNGDISLKYAFGLSSLNQLTQVGSSSTGYVQTPDVNVRSSLQHAFMRSGESLVLLGYDENDNNASETGLPGLAETWAGWLGGAKNTQNTRTSLVIVLTPTVPLGVPAAAGTTGRAVSAGGGTVTGMP